jgi:hypothetical protein
MVSQLLLSQKVARKAMPDPYGAKVYYFHTGKATLHRTYLTNNGMLYALDSLLNMPEVYTRIDSIKIIGMASPMGGDRYNRELSRKRAEALKTYIMWKHPDMDRRRISTSPGGIDWDGFRSMMESSRYIPARLEILNVIDRNTLQPEYDKVWRIAQLRHIDRENGHFLQKKIYPLLQYATLKVYLTDGRIIQSGGKGPLRELVEMKMIYDTEIPENDVRKESWEIRKIVYDTVKVQKIAEGEFLLLDTLRIFVHDTIYIRDTLEKMKPAKERYIALKNNLLYDCALLPNFAFEAYLGRGWSVEADGNWSWWSTGEPYHLAHRIQMAGVEVRKWFNGSRTPLTGHFVGVYGMGGTYDLRLKGASDTYDLGKLSNWSYSAGISYGYSWAIKKRLNIEAEISAGYFGGIYHKYNRFDPDDCFPWMSTHRLNYFGPSKAKISLVWLIGSGSNNIKSKKKK